MTESVFPLADQVPHARGASKNIPIQWLRAIAALMVLLFHASVYQPRSIFSVFDERLGIFGVALFFTISGYLMAIAVARQNAFVFLAHRIVRIYPFFLIACVLYHATTYLIPPIAPLERIAVSLVPMPYANYPLQVEWTLVFEVSFYVGLFLIALAGLGKRIGWIGLSWLICLAATSWHYINPPCMISTIYLVAEDAAMALGLLIPFLVRNKLPPTFLIALGICLYLPFAGYMPSAWAHRWLAAISAFFVLTGIVKLSQQKPSFGDNRAGRTFAHFGDYSFALYLCHSPVLRLLARLDLASNTIWLLGVGLAILIAIALGRLDVWLYRHLKSIANRTRPLPLRFGVLLFVFAYLWSAAWPVYAWYGAQSMQTRVAVITQALTNYSGMPNQIEGLARSAGYTQSDKIEGSVDHMVWQNGVLQVEGWALDNGKANDPTAVAVFQSGTLLGVTASLVSRPEINRHRHTNMLTGYKLDARTACDAKNPVVVVIITKTNQFALSKNSENLRCP